MMTIFVKYTSRFNALVGIHSLITALYVRSSVLNGTARPYNYRSQRHAGIRASALMRKMLPHNRHRSVDRGSTRPCSESKREKIARDFEMCGACVRANGIVKEQNRARANGARNSDIDPYLGSGEAEETHCAGEVESEYGTQRSRTVCQARHTFNFITLL